jgi:hypothetical protein
MNQKLKAQLDRSFKLTYDLMAHLFLIPETDRLRVALETTIS